jgi:hypothetical protein
MRDRALTFIRTLIIDEFGKKDGENILRKLGSGSLHFWPADCGERAHHGRRQQQLSPS